MELTTQICQIVRTIDMKFDSKKDIPFTLLIFGLNALLIGFAIFDQATGGMENYEYWTLIPIFGIAGLLLWFYFGTNYELSYKEGLIYRSGPFHGKIRIESITEIVKGKTLWVGFKPATSGKGLIIKYNKYDEIYISPKTKILELNYNIKITG
jgi:hypothetical protein